MAYHKYISKAIITSITPRCTGLRPLSLRRFKWVVPSTNFPRISSGENSFSGNIPNFFHLRQLLLFPLIHIYIWMIKATRLSHCEHSHSAYLFLFIFIFLGETIGLRSDFCNCSPALLPLHSNISSLFLGRI